MNVARGAGDVKTVILVNSNSKSQQPICRPPMEKTPLAGGFVSAARQNRIHGTQSPTLKN